MRPTAYVLALNMYIDSQLRYVYILVEFTNLPAFNIYICVYLLTTYRRAQHPYVLALKTQIYSPSTHIPLPSIYTSLLPLNIYISPHDSSTRSIYVYLLVLLIYISIYIYIYSCFSNISATEMCVCTYSLNIYICIRSICMTIRAQYMCIFLHNSLTRPLNILVKYTLVLDMGWLQLIGSLK